MPIVEISPLLTPYLQYEAPVNEKTKKIREMFKVDEETGYPEHYNWRPMARLGRTYKYEDPFFKFNPHDPKEDISTKVTIVGFSLMISSGIHFVFNHVSRRPWWARLWFLPLSTAFGSWLGFWGYDKAKLRQMRRNAILIDYTRKHPERFGEIYRPKLREILYVFVPSR